MKTHQNRLRRLEVTVPADVLLFDASGNTIFHWRSSRSSACPSLDAFMYLTRGVDADNEEIISTVRNARLASVNFARLHEIVASLVEGSAEVPDSKMLRSTDSVSAGQELQAAAMKGC
jgi:hypothetical protein